MKSVVSINCAIPTAEKSLAYFSGESLSDYDIAIFSPALPYLSRIQFDGGGSCLAIESTARLNGALSHWRSEFQTALKAGKTLFVAMDDLEEDSGTSGSSFEKNRRMYSTFRVNNYPSGSR